jgi:SPP1 family predicted phage head-tail adaptor
MTSAGELRHKITLQTVTAVRTGTGGVTETLATYAEVWAKVEGLRSLEFFSAKQVNSERALRFTVRYDSDITAQMRILYQTRTYRIEGIMDMPGRQRWLVLLAVEDL